MQQRWALCCRVMAVAQLQPPGLSKATKAAWWMRCHLQDYVDGDRAARYGRCLLMGQRGSGLQVLLCSCMCLVELDTASAADLVGKNP